MCFSLLEENGLTVDFAKPRPDFCVSCHGQPTSEAFSRRIHRPAAQLRPWLKRLGSNQDLESLVLEIATQLKISEGTPLVLMTCDHSASQRSTVH